MTKPRTFNRAVSAINKELKRRYHKNISMSREDTRELIAENLGDMNKHFYISIGQNNKLSFCCLPIEIKLRRLSSPNGLTFAGASFIDKIGIGDKTFEELFTHLDKKLLFDKELPFKDNPCHENNPE